MSKQKVALVCDWLTDVGGGERVILAVHEMYPDAPIYTSQFRPKTAEWFKTADVRTGWLNRFPVKLKRFIPFLRQWYFSRLDLSDYDVVISITGAEAKGVKTGAETLHVSYMHAPTQYYWTLYDQYIENPGFGVLNPVVRLALRILISPLRKEDYRAAQRPDVVIANSTYIQDEIKKHYGRDSVVVWPNVNVREIKQMASKKLSDREERSGYIIYGRQVSWKRIDLTKKKTKKKKKKLKDNGYGTENENLRRASENSEYITFLPRYKGLEEIVEYIVRSRAFLFPSIEPFVIAPVEALAAGTPVIGLAKGGALDIVKDGENGVLFEEQTVESLAGAIERFETLSFDVEAVQRSAEKFSEESFREEISRVIARGKS